MTTSPTSTKHTPRIEDDALVRGTGRFMDDPRLPNTAYAAFVRSPHAHARVTSVNSDEARKAKKVLAVLTAEDMKAANVGSVSRARAIAAFISASAARTPMTGGSCSVRNLAIPSPQSCKARVFVVHPTDAV